MTPRPRTTLADRARKARINEGLVKRQHKQMSLLNNITEAQLATLKKIKASAVRNEKVQAKSVADWHDLRKMGTIRENEGVLVLTPIGEQLASDNQAK